MTREEIIYEKMCAEDRRQSIKQTARKRAEDPKAEIVRIVTEPFDTMFFFPSHSDIVAAKKMTFAIDGHDLLSASIRMVANGHAVTARMLKLIRLRAQYKETMKFTGKEGVQS